MTTYQQDVQRFREMLAKQGMYSSDIDRIEGMFLPIIKGGGADAFEIIQQLKLLFGRRDS